jgi:outer membrane protein assembly factor BamB
LAGVLLAGTLLVGGPAPQGWESQAAHLPGLQAGADKPDARGIDGSNSGRVGASGPATLPVQVFAAQPGKPLLTAGVELDAGHNVLFYENQQVFSYAPGGGSTPTMRWQAALGTSVGSDLSCAPSMPVVGDDGHSYIGADNGSLYQIDSSGQATAIYTNQSGRALTTTPKPAGSALYVGSQDGSLVKLAVGAGTATVGWTLGGSQLGSPSPAARTPAGHSASAASRR